MSKCSFSWKEDFRALFHGWASTDGRQGYNENHSEEAVYFLPLRFCQRNCWYSFFINLSENNTNTDAVQKPYFQNLNLRTKADRNFRGTFLKNSFRHLKWYSNPPSWLARRRCHMCTFRKTEDLSSHFWESQPFRLRCVEGHRERRLKSTKTGISS